MASQKARGRVQVNYRITAEQAEQLPRTAARVAALLGLPEVSINDAVMMALSLLERWADAMESRPVVGELPPPELPGGEQARAGRPDRVVPAAGGKRGRAGKRPAE